MRDARLGDALTQLPFAKIICVLVAGALVACSHGKDSADGGKDSSGKDGGAQSAQAGASNSDAGNNPMGAGASNAGAGGARDGGPLPPLIVGTVQGPYADLLAAVTTDLKPQGIELQTKIYDDPGMLNLAVARGDLEANFFQTEPELWRWRAAHSGELGVAGKISVELMGIWSKKYPTLDAMPSTPGQRVVLPSEPQTLGRALILLHKAGLLELDERKGLDAGLADITVNARAFKFDLEPKAQVAHRFDTADLIVLDGEDALNAKLPIANAIFREDQTSAFPSVVVAMQNKVNDPRIKALVNALRGGDANRVMLDKFAGAMVPAQ